MSVSMSVMWSLLCAAVLILLVGNQQAHAGNAPIASMQTAPSTLNAALTAAGAGSSPKIAAPVTGTVVPAAGANTGTFTYTREAGGAGRVVAAAGVVVLGGTTNLGGAQSAPNVICDAMFYWSIVPPAGQAGVVRPAQWHSGHIIGAALGGSNVQPINFFPQEVGSNSAGRWFRMERIAQAAATAIGRTTAGGSLCKVSIRITFNYAGNRRIVESAPAPPNAIVRTTKAFSWIPTDGTYSISMSQSCGAAYLQLPTAGMPNYALVFRKHIKPANLAGGQYTFTHNWENGFDKADPIIDDELFYP